MQNLINIAKDFDLKIVQVIVDDENCNDNGVDNYINSSYIIGDTIYLGIYDDINKKIISFFHEIGHHIIDRDFIDETIKKQNCSFLIEQKCWQIGFELAEQYKYCFDSDVYEWANEQTKTYLRNV